MTFLYRNNLLVVKEEEGTDQQSSTCPSLLYIWLSFVPFLETNWLHPQNKTSFGRAGEASVRWSFYKKGLFSWWRDHKIYPNLLSTSIAQSHISHLVPSYLWEGERVAIETRAWLLRNLNASTPQLIYLSHWATWQDDGKPIKPAQ